MYLPIMCILHCIYSNKYSFIQQWMSIILDIAFLVSQNQHREELFLTFSLPYLVIYINYAWLNSLYIPAIGCLILYTYIGILTYTRLVMFWGISIFYTKWLSEWTYKYHQWTPIEYIVEVIYYMFILGHSLNNTQYLIQ